MNGRQVEISSIKEQFKGQKVYFFRKIYFFSYFDVMYRKPAFV